MCLLLVLDQVPKNLGPTFPIMQLKSVIHKSPCLLNAHPFQISNLQLVTLHVENIKFQAQAEITLMTSV